MGTCLQYSVAHGGKACKCLCNLCSGSHMEVNLTARGAAVARLH